MSLKGNGKKKKWKRKVETTEQERLRQRNLVYTQKIYENVYAKLSVVASSDMLVEENNKRTGNFNLIFEFLIKSFYTSLLFLQLLVSI